jgi:predicted NACHT family NTPase
MQATYNRYTFPVKYAPGADVEVFFEDMFVDVRLQMFEDSKQLPEEMTYRDVDKLLKAKRSSKRIECTQLLEVLDDKVAPHSVLIIGIPGVGKTTFVKQMAKQWAKKKMWKHVRYLFVITLRELQQDRMMTLEELLFAQLAGLSLTEDERRVAMDEIVASQEHTVVFLEGADELRSFKYTKQYERRYGKNADMNTLISSLVSGAVLPGAKVVITSRPIDQLSSKVCSRVTEIYGFSEENIKKYVHKFSGGDSELAQSILRYLDTNANIATFCYIPVTCNFVCM